MDDRGGEVRAPAIWLNPPFSQHAGGKGAWLAKAREASRTITVVVLVPVSTDTAWWIEHALHADEIRFIGERLRFGNAPDRARFSTALLIYRPAVHYTGSRGESYSLRPTNAPRVSWLLREVRS